MAIVARMARRLPALLLAVSLSACDELAPVSPTATSGSPSVAPTAVAAATPPACPGSGVRPAAEVAWDGRVFYEIFVRSFADADGDGVGDLAGLTERLDYLNDGDPATTDDLGVTGIWLMPVSESVSYHGYDVTDYTAVEQDYGDEAAMRAFVDAAHERGILVLVDFVINHTSRDHPWFEDARASGPHEDWYLWADERPRVSRPDGSRVWHESGDRFYYAYFWEGMPDLDLANPEVAAELDRAAEFWLGDIGADGFRLDAAKHLFEEGARLENVDATFEWLEGFRDRVHATHPEAVVLGEVFDATSVSSRYVQEGSLDLTFDFGLASATITALNSRSANLLSTALRDVAESYPPGTLATFLSNHDQNRVASQLSGDPAALRLAAALLLTGPGVPFLYYGEELGMTGAKPDERIRTPMRWDQAAPGFGFSTGMPWQPASNDPPGTDVATQAANADSLLSAYRDLIALRGAHPGLNRGDLLPVRSAESEVAAFLRSDGTSHALVVANLGVRPAMAPALYLDEGPLCGAPTATSLLGPAAVAGPIVSPAGGFEDYVPVTELAPREVVVIDVVAP